MTATLGCGDWTCAILRRGGVVVEELDVPVASATITRRVSQTSEATIDIQSARLCETITARSWSHEAALYRDGSLAWVGPIVGRRISGDRLTLRARDVSAWLSRRFVRSSISVVGVDAAELGAVAVDAAMLVDASPRIVVDWGAVGVRVSRTYRAEDYQYAMVALDDARDNGADWVVDGRAVLVGSARPTGVVGAVWGEHWADEPDVEEDGLAAATRIVVAGKRTNHVQPVGVFEDGDATARWGLLEQRFQDDTATTSSTAAESARVAVDQRSAPVVFVASGTLSAAAPVAYGDLVPGARLSATVRGAGTIDSVIVAVTTRIAPGSEGVAVDLEAVGGIGGLSGA